MKKALVFFLGIAILFSCAPKNSEKKGLENGIDFLSQLTSKEALILTSKEKDNSSNIYFSIDQPAKHLTDGVLYVCVEVKKEKSLEKADSQITKAFIEIFDAEKSKSDPIIMNTQKKETLGITFPPGPDDSTDWKVFKINADQNKELLSNKARVSLNLENFGTLDFTRVIIGKPATINSRVIGAFSDRAKSLTNGKIIKKGTDLLGTHKAVQFMQFPANIFGNGSKRFAGLVNFKDIPLGEKTTNADTEMVRTKDISANGGTSPIKLTQFANTSIDPITIETDEGPIKVSVTAKLSPNAESNGFITVKKDGTYESTTCLFPILTLQQVDDNNSPIGVPVVIDTAKEQIPGYPFYLASNGGKWTDTAPADRLVLSNTSNFFYNNGEVNNFIHSNGGGPGVLGACKKATVLNNI